MEELFVALGIGEVAFVVEDCLELKLSLRWLLVAGEVVIVVVLFTDVVREVVEDDNVVDEFVKVVVLLMDLLCVIRTGLVIIDDESRAGDKAAKIILHINIYLSLKLRK